jgi:uncharacterized SAM-binding protein YcdF (DUF218 family)
VSSIAGSAPAVPVAKRLGSRRRRVGCAVLMLALVGLVVVAAPRGLRSLGHWLVVDDALAEPADAIYVHAGHMPVRALEAADLFLAGHAPEVWLAEAVPTAERAALERLGLRVPVEADWNREVLQVRGVPAGAIRVLPRQVANTRDEVALVAEELRRVGGRRVVLVTSRQHSRRVRTLWRRHDVGELEATVRSSRHDPFDPDRWWTNTEDGEAVFHELVGIADAWLDLGLRPERAPGAGSK